MRRTAGLGMERTREEIVGAPIDRSPRDRRLMAGVRGAVYVPYPRGLRTGGPEALHQLVDALRRQDVEAYLVARPGTETAERVSAYDVYDAPEAPAVVDAPGNAVVAPEDIPMVLRGLQHATPFLWWLSIDNSSRFRVERRVLNAALLERPRLRTRVRGEGAKRWHGVRRAVSGERALLRRVHHLAQSQYAWSYLFSRLDVLPSKLSDYTPLSGPASLASRRDDLSIAYNPTKSADVMRRLRDRMPDARYVALEGMSRVELTAALEDVTVYLDLGHHPGKDRMPREAALSGAVSVVARRGAGAFHDDVPIPAEHKVDPTGDIVQKAIDVVVEICRDPARHRLLQDDYRRIISEERSTFDAEVHRVFVRGDLGSDR